MQIIIKFCKELYTRAIVRRPGRNFADGITTSSLGLPDFNKALEQHAAYCEALIKCGVELTVLDANERYPDGCFVEDTAVVNSMVKVISRPGAVTRRGEEEAISRVLAGSGPIESIIAPGTMEGGDVLRSENHYFIGISERTNTEGASQLSAILEKHGFTSSMIRVEAGLHLKSDIAYLGNGNFISTPAFSHVATPANTIILDSEEYYSANCLRVNDYLLIAKGFPKSKRKIIELGYNIIELDMSEFRKMDGGLTCLSLLF
jgi:dimethylargininase